ncbi:MAG: TetR/AcrR family transcriptional regulator [Bacteroidota bacterium]
MKQGDKTRLRIINTANQLFYEQGYHSTAMSDIVDKTQLSKGNINYHFKNKQGILEAVINSRIHDIIEHLKQWERNTIDPRERLTLFCKMLLNEQDNLMHYGCPMGTLTEEFSKNQPVLYQITLPMFQCYRDWLKQQFMMLDFSARSADEKAMSLLARVQGIAVLTHAFKDKDFLNREILNLIQEINKPGK